MIVQQEGRCGGVEGRRDGRREGGGREEEEKKEKNMEVPD